MVKPESLMQFSRKNTTLRDKQQEQISLIAAHLGEFALFLYEFALFSSTALPARNYNFFHELSKGNKFAA